MTRIALLLAYDGTGFHGFARQPHCRTVQGEIEDRLTTVLREPITTVAAGRTDTGVHAAGQVVSFDAPDGTDPQDLLARLNAMLAPEISCKRAAVVGEQFSARFSAVRRDYEYRIYSGPGRDPFLDRFALYVDFALDDTAMNAACKALHGEHDFTSFCRANERSLVRRVLHAGVERDGDVVVFSISATSFCHQMVRSLTGALLEIGRGRRAPEWLNEVLEARDRSRAHASVAPARGLTLIRVGYDPTPFEPA